jgi:hypothetical protein
MCERGAAVAPKTVMSLDMMMMLCGDWGVSKNSVAGIGECSEDDWN